MKTRLLIIIATCFVISGMINAAYAVSELESEDAYKKADFVFYGEILSLDILSEPLPNIENNNYTEKAGKAIYSIKIHNLVKNSPDDKVISAYGFYHLEDNPSGISFTPSLYKVGDKMKFYVKIFNESEFSYEYLIDRAEPSLYVVPPLKQIQSGIKFHNVECNIGLELAYKKSDNTSACVALPTKIELVVRGWAEDDRLLLGCTPTRYEKCYPSDPIEYRKALYDYYFDDSNLPSSKSVNFSSSHTISACSDKSVCFGKFDNGTKIRISCDYPIHGCPPVPSGEETIVE